MLRNTEDVCSITRAPNLFSLNRLQNQLGTRAFMTTLPYLSREGLP